MNFRDVGEYLELITGQPLLPKGRLYRGGSIDHVTSLDEIGQAATIISLRNREDYHEFEVDYLHFPMANKVEKYYSLQKDVKRWLNQIIRSFDKPDLKYPVLVHCLSGKDRTGIVIAALLLIIGIDQEEIVEEYLLSAGEVDPALIKQAMNGMMPIESYFKGVDIKLVAKSLKGMDPNKNLPRQH